MSTSNIIRCATDVKRMWFPTHGRIQRRIAKHSDNGWTFTGCVASGILGLLLCHLAYEQRPIGSFTPVSFGRNTEAAGAVAPVRS